MPDGRTPTLEHAFREFVCAVPTEIRDSEYDRTQAHARIGLAAPRMAVGTCPGGGIIL
jgi:hypothetical protein